MEGRSAVAVAAILSHGPVQNGRRNSVRISLPFFVAA